MEAQLVRCHITSYLIFVAVTKKLASTGLTTLWRPIGSGMVFKKLFAIGEVNAK
jgi:hypothetical protein